ncbi:MAG: cupin domain-containing protein [Planctomycetales bacterium]
MGKSTKVVRLLPGGDPVSGLAPERHAGDVFEGDPVEAAHRFFNEKRDSIKSVRAGVYEGSAYAENVVNYPCDEMAVILQGEVEIIDEDGTSHTFRPGECYFMPMGFNGVWRQSDSFRKIHMTASAV